MNAILDAALGYTESSPQWPIIPIRPGDKRPLIETGTDHAEHASTNPDMIRGWFQRWPNMLIATPTGKPSGTVVIDVDAKHDGEALLDALEHDDVLGPLPRDRVVRTRSGGLHVYLAHPGGIRVRMGGPKGQLAKLLNGRPGIDVRADGSLVVLPPSTGYRWIADDDEPLPPLPKRWLLAINGAGDPPYVPPPAVAIEISDERRVRRARAYLATMAPSISEHGGDDALWSALIAMMWGFDLDEPAVRALIVGDFNPRCEPPWDERRIDYKLAQASRATKLTRGYLLGGGR